MRATCFLLAGCCLLTIASSTAQDVTLPAETVGLDNIVSAILSGFDKVDVVALADTHWMKIHSDLRLAVVRHPDFPRKARFILIEFANTSDQPLLDRYISGEDVPLTELRRVWRNTCCPDTWDSPIYAEFLAAVRDVNKRLPNNERIRVLAGDPPAGTPTTQRDASAGSVLRDQVIGKGKALVIYGGGHLGYNNEIARVAGFIRPGNMFVVETHGGTEFDYKLFDRAIKSTERPVMFSPRRAPFRNLGTNQEADAYVYFGSGTDADTRIGLKR